MEDFETLCVIMFLVQTIFIIYFGNIALKNRDKSILLSKRLKRIENFISRKEEKNENAQEG